MGQCLSIALQVVQEAQEQQENQSNDNSNQQQQQQQQQQQHQPSAPLLHTDGKLSPVYASLPSDAEQYRVRNVYDGDTLYVLLRLLMDDFANDIY